jgi:hypothetical protein
MLKYIAGIITGTTITIIGWQITGLAIINFIKQIVEQIK